MEKYFTPITDATRVREGDILVIPSEVGAKRKRLHLAPRTYSKIGLPKVGYRTSNSLATVENILSTDHGTPTILYVDYVMQRSVTSSETNNVREFLRFLGNSTEVSGADAPVLYLDLKLLPRFTTEKRKPGEDQDQEESDSLENYLQEHFLSVMLGYATTLARDIVRPELFFIKEPYASRRSTVRPYNTDGCVQLAAETIYANLVKPAANGNPPEIESCGSLNFKLPFVDDIEYAPARATGPTDGGKPAPLPDSDIQSLLGHAPFGCYTEYPRDGGVGLSRVPPAFLKNLQIRGATLYRPSRAFLNMATANILSDRFDVYLRTCDKVLQHVKAFSRELEAGVSRIKNKMAIASKARSAMRAKGNTTKINKALKEVIHG